MTNYNDGQIHGWNGGDCPVHPETVVKVWFDWKNSQIEEAQGFDWSKSDLMARESDIIAFRVVKPYVEPRVIWVNEHEDGYHTAHNTEERAKHSARYSRIIRIAVKYQECKE